MNLLKQQADKLRDACRRLREAGATFEQANQALRFAAKRTRKRTSGKADVLEFNRKAEK
jgi:hypothetical protein